MINAKGEVIYTNTEIAYELGLSPATVNAIGRRLFGNGRIPHWTLNDAKLIVEYIKSISVEEDARRLSVLHDAVHDIMGDCKLDDADTRKRMVMTKGESMRKARNRAKMSAAQLSRISGVPATTIYALERGTARNGRIDTIELLADALRISIDEYIGRRR